MQIGMIGLGRMGAGMVTRVSEGEFGLDLGVIVLMIENFRTGLLWRLTRNMAWLQAGLKRAGFSGGWL